MKYCKKCGRELDDRATFCPSCGTQVSKRTNQGGGNDNKKIIIILAAVLAAIVIICATVIVIFATKNSSKEEVTTQVTTAATTTANPNISDKNRLNSLYERYGDANVKAEKKGVNVKKEKKVAKASLERYKTAIENNDTSVLGEYGQAAEKAVSKLESATNKTKKIKKKNRIRANSIPESEKTDYSLRPTHALSLEMNYMHNTDATLKLIRSKNILSIKVGMKIEEERQMISI